MNASAAARLRRLRLLLTLMFTGMNAAGLIVFAWLVVHEDSEQAEQRLDGDLRRVTSVVTRLLDYKGGQILTAAIGRDELNDQCPQFVVQPTGEVAFPRVVSRKTCVQVDDERVNRIALQAADSSTLINGYIRGRNGQLVRIAAEPFRSKDGGPNVGAVVASVDAAPEQAKHDDLTLLVIGSCVLLVGVVAYAGHWLSGRAIRPAAAALEQHEMLLAETAHDLRTPVAALRALAETAMRNPTQSAELLPRTVQLASRMGSTIDGLLIRTRLAAGVEQLDSKPVWLDQLVAGVIEQTPADGASVTLNARPTKVLADASLLQRAIGNLLDNALRYGHQPNAKAVVHLTVSGGRVMVADHGPGIDPAKASQNFDRFQSAGGSSGLGLSIVRWVAETHGGMLRVYNAEQGGAIFELALPVSPN